MRESVNERKRERERERPLWEGAVVFEECVQVFSLTVLQHSAETEENENRNKNEAMET